MLYINALSSKNFANAILKVCWFVHNVSFYERNLAGSTARLHTTGTLVSFLKTFYCYSTSFVFIPQALFLFSIRFWMLCVLILFLVTCLVLSAVRQVSANVVIAPS